MAMAPVRRELSESLGMAALVEVQELLASLIEDFSKSQHTKRVKDNLASVAAQVQSLQEEIDARAGSAP